MTADEGFRIPEPDHGCCAAARARVFGQRPARADAVSGRDRGGGRGRSSGGYGAAGLDGYFQSCQTTRGRLDHLAPVVRMSKTQPVWKLPPPDQGADQPRWQ